MLDIALRKLKDQLLNPFVDLFRNVSPNKITLASGAFGILCAWFAAIKSFNTALLMWLMNRCLDGLDGAVARKFNKASDFGGYLDILVDFAVYALIPIGISIGNDRESEMKWIVLACLEGIYFVNAAGLFQLSAILEKRNLGAKTKKELTTITMPPALIEGAETVIFYSLFLIFNKYSTFLFGLFGFLVFLTVCQRLIWARLNI